MSVSVYWVFQKYSSRLCSSSSLSAHAESIPLPLSVRCKYYRRHNTSQIRSYSEATCDVLMIEYDPKLRINSNYMVRLAFIIHYNSQEITRVLVNHPPEPLV
jgi:hypothetical protein